MTAFVNINQCADILYVGVFHIRNILYKAQKCRHSTQKANQTFQHIYSERI